MKMMADSSPMLSVRRVSVSVLFPGVYPLFSHIISVAVAITHPNVPSCVLSPPSLPIQISSSYISVSFSLS